MRIAQSAILGEENTAMGGEVGGKGGERKETRKVALLHIFRLMV